MRVVGIDFGRVRIGIAVAETSAKVVGLRKPIPASGTLLKDVQAITDLARAEEAEALVVGVPLGVEGSKQTAICQRIAGMLRDAGWTVHEVDESLTSVESNGALFEQGLTAAQRKKEVDSYAASLILERFMHGNG